MVLRIWIIVTSGLWSTKANINSHFFRENLKKENISDRLFCCTIRYIGVLVKSSYNDNFIFNLLSLKAGEGGCENCRLVRQLLIFNRKLLYRRNNFISTVWPSLCPPKQYALHMERETATFVFGGFFGICL